VLRKGLPFPNGDPVTAEDAKYSFERCEGPRATMPKTRVAAGESSGPIACGSA
jgi:ABC-type transport system substrate-binding protein